MQNVLSEWMATKQYLCLHQKPKNACEREAREVTGRRHLHSIEATGVSIATTRVSLDRTASTMTLESLSSTML